MRKVEPDGPNRSRFTLVEAGITDETVDMGKRGWGGTLARLAQVLGLTQAG